MIQTGEIINILNSETVGQAPKTMTIKKIIVKTKGEYPQSVAIDFMNKNIDKLAQFKIGDIVDVNVDLRSREYNNKWYSNIIGYGIQSGAEAVQSSDQLPDSNDLPF